MGVFARKGADATSVEDLLEAAGVARRTFYRHFRSKDDVLDGICEVVAGGLLRSVRAASREGTDPLSGVHFGLDAFFDFHVDNAPLLRVLAEEGQRWGTPIAARRAALHQGLYDIFDAASAGALGFRLEPYVFVALMEAIEGLSLHLLRAGAHAPEIARAKAVARGLIRLALSPPTAETLPRREGP
jgi:AcrR family transcriptional regulator